MTKEKNPTQGKIAIKNETFEVMLDCSKKQLENLLKDPKVSEAFRLKRVLENMQPEAIGDSNYSARISERGADAEERIMRKKPQIEEDRLNILAECESIKAIKLMPLFKKLYPNLTKGDVANQKYKIMYNDVNYLIEKGNLSKNNEMITFKNLEPAK